MSGPHQSAPHTASSAAFCLFYNWSFAEDHAIEWFRQKDKRAAAKLNYRLKKTIAMVGMMGAGKTAVGSAVAKRLGVPFLDSDREIEKAANMTIAEIFVRDGEVFFRDKETKVIGRLLEEERCILSTGGGAYLSARNREIITRHGVAVWLRADIDLLWSRVRHKNTRPLLRTANPRQTLGDLYEARVPEYGKAEIIVDANPKYSIDDMATQVIEALQARPDILEVIE